MDVAKTGYVMTGGQKASDLRASSAIALARIAGKETYEPFKALTEKETAAQGVFGSALERINVANECDRDLTCYGKKLNDPLWERSEKAAFAIAFSGDAKKGLPILLGAMKPITTMIPERYPVHQAILVRAGAPRHQGLQECIEELDKQIERDEKAVRCRARDLPGETRVTGRHLEQGRERRHRPTGRRRPKKQRRPPPPRAEGRPKPAKPAKGKKKKK
jgi:hypothetical protein